MLNQRTTGKCWNYNTVPQVGRYMRQIIFWLQTKTVSTLWHILKFFKVQKTKTRPDKTPSKASFVRNSIFLPTSSHSSRTYSRDWLIPRAPPHTTLLSTTNTTHPCHFRKLGLERQPQWLRVLTSGYSQLPVLSFQRSMDTHMCGVLTHTHTIFSSSLPDLIPTPIITLLLSFPLTIPQSAVSTQSL